MRPRELNGPNVRGMGFIALHERFDRIADEGYAGTADLFTGQSRQTDKHLWLVEVHLSGTKGE
jgi:DNA-binding ferritin-like protein